MLIDELIEQIPFFDEYERDKYQSVCDLEVTAIVPKRNCVWGIRDGKEVHLPLSYLRTDGVDLFLPLWLYAKVF